MQNSTNSRLSIFLRNNPGTPSNDRKRSRLERTSMLSTATADDVIKEAEERVKTYYEQGNEWRRRASTVTLEKSDLENKMQTLSKHYKEQIKTLVDEIERLQNLLIKKGSDDDEDDCNENLEELTKMRKLQEKLEKSLNSAELEKSRLAFELNDLKQKYSKDIMKTEKESAAAEKKNEGMLQQIKENKERLNHVEAQKERLQRQLELLARDSEEKTKSRSDMSTELVALKLKLSQKLQDFDRQSEEINQLKNEIRSKRIDVVQTNDKIIVLKDSNSELSSRLQKKQDELCAKEKQYLGALEKLEILDKKNKERSHGDSAENSSLRADLANKVKEIEHLNKRLEAKNEESEKWRRELVSAHLQKEKNIQLTEKIQKLETELARKEATVVQLESLNGSLEEKTSRFSTLEAIILEKDKKIQQIESSLDKKANQLETEKNGLQTELKERERELIHKESASEKRVEELESQIQKQIYHVQELKEREKEFIHKENVLEKKVEELEDQIQKQICRIQESERKEKEGSYGIEKLNIRIQELQEKLSSAHTSAKHMDDLESVLKELQDEHEKKESSSKLEIERLQVRVKTLQEKIGSLETQLKDNIEDSANHVNTLERLLYEKRKEFESKERLSSQKVHQLEVRNQELQKDLKFCEARLVEISEDAVSQIRTLENLLEEKKKAYEHTEDLKTQRIDEMETRIHVLQGKLGHAERKMDEMRKEAQTAGSNLQEKEEEYERKFTMANDQISQLQERNQSLRSKLLNAERRYEETIRERADSTNELHVMEQKQREYEKTIEGLKVSVKDKQEELERKDRSVNQKLRQLEGHLQTLQDQLAFAEKELEEKNDEISIQENSIHTLTRDKESVESKWREALQKARQLEPQIQSLQSKLSAVEDERMTLSKLSSKMENTLHENQEDFNNKIRAANFKLQELEDQNRIVNEKLKFTEEKVDNVTEQNQVLEQECQRLENTELLIEDRSRRISQLEKDVESILKDLSIATERKALAEKEHQDLQQKLSVASQTIEEKNLELDRIKDLIRDILQEKYKNNK